MTIEEVNATEYARVIREPYHVFGSAEFNELNSHKAEQVYYFLFKDSRYRLGLIAAKSGPTLVSPFSAPFGGFTYAFEDIRLLAIEEAVWLTEGWSEKNGMNQIRYILPPPIYQESYLAKVSNVLYRSGYSVENMELNFYFDLSKFTTGYHEHIWHNARKNLRIALTNKLSFEKCDLISDKESAYRVIERNRVVRGKPLRMSWEQVLATSNLIKNHFFRVTSDEGTIAAAIIFVVAPRIAQVIYWGDLPEYQHMKTMNYLSFKVFEFYSQLNFLAVDIGYSTENSVPNYGLCEFKEGLGCNIQPKFTYSKIFVSQ